MVFSTSSNAMSITAGKCRSEFLLKKEVVNLNHGSFGAVPKMVLKEQRRIQDETEKCPDEFYRMQSFKIWMSNLNCLADFLRANPNNITFVENTTTGVNTVLRSLQFAKHDGILCSELTYPAVLQTIKAVQKSHNGIKVFSLNVKFPISSVADIVSRYQTYIKNNPGIKLAIIDHITSGTAVKLPVQELIRLCHKHNILVLVDGAHAAGQILDLNLEEINADFYTGSLHKWCFCARGCGFLWIAPRFHDHIQPVVTSHFRDRQLHWRFFMTGTRDNSAYYTFSTARQFRDSLGGMSSMHSYSTALLTQAEEMLIRKWQTNRLQIPREMEAPFLRLIKLPELRSYETTPKDAYRLKLDLHVIHNVVSIIVCLQGDLYVRLSVCVYNTLVEYKKLRDIVHRLRTENAETCAESLGDLQYTILTQCAGSDSASQGVRD